MRSSALLSCVTISSFVMFDSKYGVGSLATLPGDRELANATLKDGASQYIS